MHQKLVPGAFLILIYNIKQQLNARNSFKNDTLKEDYQKALKKVNFFFFRTQSFLMKKIIKNKMGLELVTSCSSGYQASSEKFLYCLYII